MIQEENDFSIFAKLPNELLYHILEYDGKIICPKMDKTHQSNIIHYLKNSNKKREYKLNFLPFKGPLINILLCGNDYTYIGNDLLFIHTYNHEEENEIESENYLDIGYRPFLQERLNGFLENNYNDSNKKKIERVQRQLDIIDGKVLPRTQNYPNHHESILHINKRLETTHFRHDYTKEPETDDSDFLIEIHEYA